MKKSSVFSVIFIIILISIGIKHRMILKSIGNFLIVNQNPGQADAAIVLYSGVDWYPRLLEAADLYRTGHVKTVVINGDRKNDVLRQIEQKGFEPPCPWYSDAFKILGLYGVSPKDIMAISAENAYDTVSEAKFLGNILQKRGINNIIITTSKYHSRRALFIWKQLYADTFRISSVVAKEDPFRPDRWWKDGRQIRSVLSEYGAFVYYWWKYILEHV